MSLYNLINGFNPACVWIMPMLGRKHGEYPRFRDCFVSDGKIEIYTRVGGGNRHQGYGEEALYEDPNFVRTYDDEFDNTYGTYVFNVPEQWKLDFDKLVGGDIGNTSLEYQAMIREFYPELDKNGFLDSFFTKREAVSQ